jgi:beta-xylosidase
MFEDVEGKYEFKPETKGDNEPLLTKERERPKSYFSNVETSTTKQLSEEKTPTTKPTSTTSLKIELENELEEEKLKQQQQQQLSFVDAPTKVEKQTSKLKSTVEKKMEILDYAECYPGYNIFLSFVETHFNI